MYILPALPAVALAAAPFLSAIAGARRLPARAARLALALSAVLARARPAGADRAAGVGAGAGQRARPRRGGALAVVDAGRGRRASAWRACAWRGAKAPARAGRPAAGAVARLRLRRLPGAGCRAVRRARSCSARAPSPAPQRRSAWSTGRSRTCCRRVGPTVEFGYRRPAAERLALASAWLAADPAKRLLLFSEPQRGRPCFSAQADTAPCAGSARPTRRDWFLVADPAHRPCLLRPRRGGARRSLAGPHRRRRWR